MSEPTLHAQFTIHGLSVLLNSFGIYCLRKQRIRKRSEGYSLLMQNLAYVEILKMAYDIIPLSTYHYYPNWYYHNHIYFEVIETATLSIFFTAFLLILLDEVLIVLFPVRRRRLSGKVVKRVIGATWFVGIISAPSTWMIPRESVVRVIYYLVYEFLISLMSLVFLVVIRKKCRGRDQSFPSANERRTFTISILLLIFFILFNAIPDFIFFFNQQHHIYLVVSFCWSVGCLIDPLIYIFMNRKTAKIATRFLLLSSSFSISSTTFISW